MKILSKSFVLAVASLVGCERHPASSGHRATDFSTNVIAYEVKGVLKEIRGDGWKALIAHEDSPGYMEAMTMLLDVKRTNELRGLSPGDAIRFRMLVTDTDGWIDRVQKIGTNAPMAVAPNITNAALTATAQVDELEPGAVLPDCTLTNQLGKAIRLSEFKGRALAFTFIFTRCPFPTFCPRMNNNLGSVQRELAAAAGATNWHLLSISFDPEFDTPTRLGKYADTYHHDPTHWSFATGAASDIRQLGSAFGLSFWREGALFNHNVRTVVVDTQGRVQKLFTNNEWSPAELAEEMKKAMVVKP